MTTDDLSAVLLTPDEMRKVVAKSHIPPNEKDTRAEGNLDLPEFFTTIYQMLRVDCPRVIFVPSYPKYLKPGTPEFEATFNIPTPKFAPTITYSVTKREPATMGGNKQPFGTGYKEYVPKERRTIGNADGTQTIIYGQNFDNLVRFNTWTLTSVEAEQLINWFEQYLRERRDFLRNLGLGEILFWFRGEEKEVPILDNGLEMRTATFYVRTEELSVADEDVLKNLEFKTDVRRTT